MPPPTFAALFFFSDSPLKGDVFVVEDDASCMSSVEL